MTYEELKTLLSKAEGVISGDYVVRPYDKDECIEIYLPVESDYYVDIDASITSPSFYLKEYAYDFDLDEFVYMWLDAKRFGKEGVPDARGLVEEADQIVESLKELSMQLLPLEREMELNAKRLRKENQHDV